MKALLTHFYAIAPATIGALLVAHGFRTGMHNLTILGALFLVCAALSFMLFQFFTFHLQEDVTVEELEPEEAAHRLTQSRN